MSAGAQALNSRCGFSNFNRISSSHVFTQLLSLVWTKVTPTLDVFRAPALRIDISLQSGTYGGKLSSIGAAAHLEICSIRDTSSLAYNC
jgi:hypothetical protein